MPYNKSEIMNAAWRLLKSGYDDNNFTTIITAIEDYNRSGKYIVINFELNGSKQNICMKPNEMIKRIALAIAKDGAA